MISIEKLAKAIGTTVKRIEPFYEWLELYMDLFKINTPLREAAFLAQIAHESGRFYLSEEIASGVRYDTGSLAVKLGNTPQADGDGQRYKGRGLIQLTGKANYQRISKDLGVDFLNMPQLLKEPEYAVLSACWYWDTRDLNTLADMRDFRMITKKINGGYNGMEDREKLYNSLLKNYGI